MKTLELNTVEEVVQKKEIPFIAYEGALKRAIEIANFYGFKLIEPPEVKGNHKRAYKEDDFYVPVEEKTELLRRFSLGEFGNAGFPAMVCYTKKNPVKRSMGLRLDIIGSGKSIADALVISASLAISKELLGKNICIDINNIGDKEAYNSYLKELSLYYKKNAAGLDQKCKQIIKKDILKIFSCESPKCLSLREDAPRPLAFLGDSSRSHFKEVIEFLENMDVTYQISNVAVSNSEYTNKTIFELRSFSKEDEIYKREGDSALARGGRYDSLSKKLGIKKAVPSVGITIKFDNVSSKESYKKKSPEKNKAKVYLIQFGFSAKLRSLKLLELFRINKIPLLHGLMRDDLGSQLSSAEKANVPFIAIIGQKEVVENTVMIRNMENRSQDSIAVSRLGNYLKDEIKKLADKK